jgi:hypothetical protein
MKLKLPVALVCVAAALISLVAASPTPGISESPTPGISASPTPGISASPSAIPSASTSTIPSPSTATGPVGVDFSIQVQRGSVLHLQDAAPCPVLPRGQAPSRIDVTAVISTSTDSDGNPTASAMARVGAKRNWQLDLIVPAYATLGKATLQLTCAAGTTHGPYVASQSHPIWIIEATPTPDEPNWPPLLLLILIVGLVLGRELSRYRIWPFATGSAAAASEDAAADVAPEGGTSGTGKEV